MLASLLLALAQGVTWTVDDDGPADFPNLVIAELAASDGDRILVAPGIYDGFATAKKLTVLGPGAGPKPVVGAVRVQNSTGFTLAGLNIDWLRMVGISGPAVVDDCIVRHLGPMSPTFVKGAVALQNCGMVILSRLIIDLDGECAYGGGGAAVFSFQSNLSLSESTLRGPRGCHDSTGYSYDYGEGGRAVDVRGGTAIVAASELRGNVPGAVCGPLGCSSCCYGNHGWAVRVGQGAKVRLRGSGHVVQGSGLFQASGPYFAYIEGGSVLVSSGVQAVGTVAPYAPLGQHIQVPAEPFLDTTGGNAPGDTKRVRVRGPSGTSWLAFASAAAVETPLPGVFGTPAWVSPSAVLLVVSGEVPPGGISPVTFTLPPTAALAGLAVHFQAFFPAVLEPLAPGGMVVSNVIPLVLRF